MHAMAISRIKIINSRSKQFDNFTLWWNGQNACNMNAHICVTKMQLYELLTSSLMIKPEFGIGSWVDLTFIAVRGIFVDPFRPWALTIPTGWLDFRWRAFSNDFNLWRETVVTLIKKYYYSMNHTTWSECICETTIDFLQSLLSCFNI